MATGDASLDAGVGAAGSTPRPSGALGGGVAGSRIVTAVSSLWFPSRSGGGAATVIGIRCVGGITSGLVRGGGGGAGGDGVLGDGVGALAPAELLCALDEGDGADEVFDARAGAPPDPAADADPLRVVDSAGSAPACCGKVVRVAVADVGAGRATGAGACSAGGRACGAGLGDTGGAGTVPGAGESCFGQLAMMGPSRSDFCFSTVAIVLMMSAL